MALSKQDPTHVMIQVGRSVDPNYVALMWRCPGCKSIHHLHAKGHGEPVDGGPTWSWNESMTAPTFSPSILKDTRKGAEVRCHSFVKDGHVQFLNDCDHSLQGRTVAMVPEDANPWDDWVKEDE